MAYDAALPFRKDPTTGFATIESLKAAVHQDLRILLLTVPGERVMDPLFGVGLKTYLFEPLTATTLGKVESAINKQVKTYLSFITIEYVRFSSALDSGPNSLIVDMNENVLGITIGYSYGHGVFDEIMVTA